MQHIARAAAFAPGDDEATRRERLNALFARDGLTGEAPALLAALMGIAPPLAMPPAQARARTLDALIGWLEAMALRGPVLWVLEDAHWIDRTTLELVDLALERIAAARVLALVTARPTFLHGFGGHPVVTSLSLNRLGREAVGAIIARITGGKTIPEALTNEITARTDGVPLYVEEMTKAVLESGAVRETADAFVLDGPLDRLAIPSSLHDSLMARLDRLQPVKEVAQTAAVIGRAFDHAALAALSPLPERELAQALDRLVAAELVFRRGAAPEASYLFKHALVRDAAYGSLLRSKRQALHRRLVAVLEASKAGPELLAQHAQAGGETARAITWWREAAEAAVGRGAFAEAGAHLDAAEGLLPGLDDVALRRREAAGTAVARALASLVQHGYSDSRTVALYRRAVDLAEDADDPKALLSAIYGVWAFHHVAEAPGAALEVADRMLGDALRAADGDLEMMAHRARGISLTMAGRLDEARAAFECGETLYDPERHRALAVTIGIDPVVGIKCYGAMAELALGHPDRALAAVASGLEIAGLTDSLNTRAYVLYHASAVAAYARRTTQAMTLGSELAAMSSQYGLSLWSGMVLGILGIARLDAGDAAGALGDLRRCLEASKASGSGLLGSFPLAAMAEAMTATGDAGALAIATSAEEHARRTGALYALAEAQRRYGVVLRRLRPDDRAGAEAAFRRAIATARGQNARLWELRAACDLVRLLGEQGRSDDARALLLPLRGSFTEGLDTPDLIDTEALLERMP